MSREPIAIIDIGSNSGRVTVVGMFQDHLEVLADGRTPLRLANELTAGVLSDEAIERTVRAARDFRSIALAAGARTVVAVATAAVRESANAAILLDLLRTDAGIEARVVSGEEEARYAVLGAVRGLNVSDGLVVDIGGGSLEAGFFRDRQLDRTWTLPLGALRLTDAFIESDPPRSKELRRLREHAEGLLAETDIPLLERGQHLVGTGGTIRALAKLDAREQSHPIPRIHGYELHRERVGAWGRILGERTIARRRTIRGLNPDRADSIVAGSIVTDTVMAAVGANSITVTGQGLREGIAYDLSPHTMPTPEAVRRGSIDALTARFLTWQQPAAEQRARIATGVVRALVPGAPDELVELTRYAGLVLDIGRSVDHYSRAAHAADIVIAADLLGFSHRQLALMSVLIRSTEQTGTASKAYQRLLDAGDHRWLVMGGAALAIADAITSRTPRGADDSTEIATEDGELVISSRVPATWCSPGLVKRLARAAERTLVAKEAPR